MAKRRLHVDAQLAPDTSLTLDPDRSHYLCRVLRQRRGDHVLLFCGDGDGYDARIDNADARACEVRVGSRDRHTSRTAFAAAPRASDDQRRSTRFCPAKGDRTRRHGHLVDRNRSAPKCISKARVSRGAKRTGSASSKVPPNSAVACVFRRCTPRLTLIDLFERRPAAQLLLLDPGGAADRYRAGTRRHACCS